MSDIIALWGAVIKIVFMAAPVWLPIVLWQKREAICQYLFGQPTVKRIPTIVISSDRIRDHPDPWFYADNVSEPEDIMANGSDANDQLLPVVTQQLASSSATDAALRKLNDEGYHRLIIGYTGGGKTTLLHKLAVDWAASGLRVLVCDPDAAPGQWPGCRVVGHGDDFEQIGAALDLTMRDVEQRRQQRGQGRRVFAPLHVVCDEVQDILESCDNALPILETIIRRGRKLNVLLTLGVQDRQVKTLGLEGKSHLLTNLIQAEVKKRDGRRVAIIDGESYPLPNLPSPDDFIVAPGPEDLLRTSLQAASARNSVMSAVTASESAVTSRNSVTNSVTSAVTSDVTASESAVTDVVTSRNSVTNSLVTAQESAQIALLLTTYSPSMVARKLPGYTPPKYADYKAKVDYVKTLIDKIDVGLEEL